MKQNLQILLSSIAITTALSGCGLNTEGKSPQCEGGSPIPSGSVTKIDGNEITFQTCDNLGLYAVTGSDFCGDLNTELGQSLAPGQWTTITKSEQKPFVKPTPFNARALRNGQIRTGDQLCQGDRGRLFYRPQARK